MAVHTRGLLRLEEFVDGTTRSRLVGRHVDGLIGTLAQRVVGGGRVGDVCSVAVVELLLKIGRRIVVQRNA